jgi:hypothetical protein
MLFQARHVSLKDTRLSFVQMAGNMSVCNQNKLPYGVLQMFLYLGKVNMELQLDATITVLLISKIS